jgi:hypothetical protein
LAEAIQWGSVNASAVLYKKLARKKDCFQREQLEHNLHNPPAPWVTEAL